MKDQQIWFVSVFVGSNFYENMVNVLLEVYKGIDPKFEFCIDAGLEQQVKTIPLSIQKRILNKFPSLFRTHPWRT
jgi:hypothetical protein